MLKVTRYYGCVKKLLDVMHDERTYDYAIALRAVTISDFTIAKLADLLWEYLGKVATRIINEIKGVNRVRFKR